MGKRITIQHIDDQGKEHYDVLDVPEGATELECDNLAANYIQNKNAGEEARARQIQNYAQQTFTLQSWTNTRADGDEVLINV